MLRPTPTLPRLASLALLLCLCLPLTAQPGDHVYGPRAQTYALPEVGAGTIYYVAPDGTDDADGTRLNAPTSLEAAVAKVRTGDAIVLRGGTYRTGGLVLSQGVTLQPYQDERPILKGTRVVSGWQKTRNGLYAAKWETLFPTEAPDWWRRGSEGRKTPPHLFHYDMVFLDGKLLNAKGWEGELDDNSYVIDYTNRMIYLATDPTDRVVEATAYDSALVRTMGEAHGKPNDRVGVKIRGLTFTQYAYRALEIEATEGDGVGPTPEAKMGNEVVGSLLEDVTMTYCSRVAGYFRGNDLVIRNCLVSHTGFEGIYVLSSADAVLEGNIVTQTNIENITGVYPTAIKIFNQTHRVIVRDNLIIDNPNSSGVWYDVGNRDGQFYDNWVETTDNGFFFEISQGVTVAGNVFVNCGTGIYILNSADAAIYQNTLVDSTLKIERNNRGADTDHFGWHITTGPKVPERDGHILQNNLMVASSTFRKPLLQTLQTDDLCGKLTTPQVAQEGHNVYIHLGQEALIEWAPVQAEGCKTAWTDLSGLQSLGLAEGSQVYTADLSQVFANAPLKRYTPQASAPGLKSGAALPKDVQALVPWMQAHPGVVGAFPVAK